MNYLFDAMGEVDHSVVVKVAHSMVSKGRLAYQVDGKGSYLSYNSALSVALRDIWRYVHEYKKCMPPKFERRSLPRDFAWREPAPRTIAVAKKHTL